MVPLLAAALLVLSGCAEERSSRAQTVDPPSESSAATEPAPARLPLKTLTVDPQSVHGSTALRHSRSVREVRQPATAPCASRFISPFVRSDPYDLTRGVRGMSAVPMFSPSDQSCTRCPGRSIHGTLNGVATRPKYDPLRRYLAAA